MGQETIYRGDLVITTKAQAKQYAHVDEVTGSLYIRADAQLPVLTTVGGVEISMRPLTILGFQWPITILDKTMRIGCQEHPLDDWATFDNAQIAAMDGSNAVKLWALNKETILSAAREAGRVFGVEVAA